MKKYPDDDIYKSIFSKYKIGGIVKLTTNDAAEIDNQFSLLEKGKIRNPTLSYPLLKDYSAKEIIAHLEKSLEELNIPENLKDIYTYAIQQHLLEQKLLESVKNNNVDEIVKYNFALYGEINTELFNYSLFSLEKELSKYEDSNEFKNYFKKNINFNYDKEKALEVESIINTPFPDELKNEIINEINIKFELPKQDSFTSEEMISIISKILIENKFEKWKVVISEKYVGFTITGNNRTIHIPKNRIYLNKRFHRLLFHEIGVHVRRMNNTRQNAKYKIQRKLIISREEGIASLIEEVFGLQEKFQTFTYLMVCLTLGMDGRKRDFNDIYNLRLNKQLLKGNTDNLLEAKKDIFAQTVKLFRASDFNTPGVSLLRPKQYGEDNYFVRKYLLENPNNFSKIMKLRYDFLDTNLERIISALN